MTNGLGWSWLVVLLAAPLAAQEPSAPAPIEPVTASDILSQPEPAWSVQWKNGVRFVRSDGEFDLFMGGRIHLDAASYLAPRAVRQALSTPYPLDDGVHPRRARLSMGGKLYEHIDFWAEFDFANAFVSSPVPLRVSDHVVPTDLWMTFSELPVIGNLRVGNQKPGLSFEHATSSRFLNFLERSISFDAFVEDSDNGFRPGIQAFDTYLNKRGTWFLGVFKNTRSPLGWNVGRNETDVTGRLTFLPVYEDDGRTLIHAGLGASHRDLDDGVTRFRSRLGVRNSPGAVANIIADTGTIPGSNQQTIVPEFVAVWGPWSCQAEYYGSWVHGTRDGTIYVSSATAEVHYFLTGEHRAYETGRARFDRVVPRQNARWNRTDGLTSLGAWQIMARYSWLDLNAESIRGGRAHEWAAGVNWYLNPNLKMQANYVLTRVDAAARGFIHGFGVRTAWDF